MFHRLLVAAGLVDIKIITFQQDVRGPLSPLPRPEWHYALSVKKVAGGGGEGGCVDGWMGVEEEGVACQGGGARVVGGGLRVP